MPAEVLKEQYKLLQGSRAALFAYCETLTPADFVQELPGFGHGSIRNLIGHIANTYTHWLPNYALGGLLPYVEVASPIMAMPDVYPVFEQTDQHVQTFLHHFADSLYTVIDRKLPTRNFNVTTTPLALFTHVLTHETHHKGQIVSMSRHMGYTPPDTDLIRF